MAQISQLLARLKRDPLADLPIADHLNQLLEAHKVAWRDRLLPPLVTLRLFLIQIAHCCSGFTNWANNRPRPARAWPSRP